MRLRLAVVLVGTLTLAGCGGHGAASDSTVAYCLRAQLNYNVTSGCHGLKEFQTGHVDVTCVHQNANQYLCNASDGSSYAVTYDGRNIAWQQQP